MTVPPDSPSPPELPTDEPAPEESAVRDEGPPEEPRGGTDRERRAETNDQLLRVLAELDNVRKRARREAEEARRSTLANLFTDLLAVKDSLELGLAACRGEEGPVVEGLGMTLRLLDQLFERYAVETIDPENEAFDPHRHEAMATRPTSDHAPGTILLVVQKGYELHGRLLRPARVVVAAPPA
jgi:molecular chaperone GrpE